MLTDLLAIAVIVGIFLIGYLTGMTTKGFNITITHKEAEKPAPIPPEDVKYNQSTAKMLPPEVQAYYEKTNGFIE